MKKNDYGNLLKTQIDRRSFLKGSALLGMTGIATSIHGTDINNQDKEHISVNSKKEDVIRYPDFKFDKNGKFKILQLTDTHYRAGDPRSERALKNVKEMLDNEKPDFVIHTGDIISGEPISSLQEILSPIFDRKIPFAVALGNHDEEFGKSRQEIFDIIKDMPYNVNHGVDGIFGVSNDIITISSAEDNAVKRVLYLFDSNRSSTIEGIDGYGHIHFDQITWYRKHSEYYKIKNGGIPVPALAFFHIPLPEYKYALIGLKDNKLSLKGNWGEDICPPSVNSGLFVSMKEMNDIQAIFVGHDHSNDYAAKWQGMFFIYGRFSGCDIVYNDLKPNGARVIEITNSEAGFRSWIRLFGGEITQNLKFPEDFRSH